MLCCAVLCCAVLCCTVLWDLPAIGGDLVWQCHAPLRIMQEKGLGFDAVKGEAISSHADNTTTTTSGSSSGLPSAAEGGSSAGSTSRRDVKARCLKAFETFPPEFLDVVNATPAEVSVSCQRRGHLSCPCVQLSDGCSCLPVTHASKADHMLCLHHHSCICLRKLQLYRALSIARAVCTCAQFLNLVTPSSPVLYSLSQTPPVVKMTTCRLSRSMASTSAHLIRSQMASGEPAW
jgi:hypothetical protein